MLAFLMLGQAGLQSAHVSTCSVDVKSLMFWETQLYFLMNFKEVSLLCLMGSCPILIYSVNVTICQPFDLNETVPHQLHGGQKAPWYIFND